MKKRGRVAETVIAEDDVEKHRGEGELRLRET